MKLPSKSVIVLISIPILILLFFSSNIYGYFRFKHYCSTEGGLRVYEKLERNVGWFAKDKYDAQVAAQLSGVGFVRYRDQKNGNFYDLIYKGGNPTKDSSFEKKLADHSLAVVYEWRHISEFVAGEIRLGKFGYEIFNLKDNHLMARFYSLSYSKLDRPRTLFDIPSGISCFNNTAEKSGEFDEFISALNTIFKN
jgi:hypothetical protein